MSNVGRCPRCNAFLVAEQQAAHVCDFRDVPIRSYREVVLDHMTDCGTDKRGDGVKLGWGIDGTLYRFLICRHNPPHSAKRDFTGSCTKQGLDSPTIEKA
jgi:hypothetical protein